MTASRWFRAAWFAAGLAVVLGLGREVLLGLRPPPRELPRQDGATGRPWITGGFALGAAAMEIDPGLLPRNVQAASSGPHGDAWQGRAETAWFRVTRRWWIHVAVAGYPQHRGCRLWAEFQLADGTITRRDCPLPDPGERWNRWEIRRPAGALAVRLVAEDSAGDSGGWLGFSHPFRAWPGAIAAAYHFAQLITTVALALTLLWGPGLLWIPPANTPETRIVFMLGLGPLLLAAAGVMVWTLGGWVRPMSTASVSVTVLWVALGISGRRAGWNPSLSDGPRRMLAVSALVVIGVVAKSSTSRGPEGELFRGSVSRNLTVGDRIDSRYPFHVVQAAAHRLGPASPAAESFFYPWTFFSRGPLAGLATTPVVLATGGQPPAEMPDQRWAPFDRTGFAAYRVTMIVLASGIVVATFALLVPFVGERWAAIGGGLLALSPFGVHEMMFTWPKWAATAWIAIGFLLAHARRPAGAGFALAFGFFFHPMVLLWAPWLVLWAAARRAGRWRRRAVGGETNPVVLGDAWKQTTASVWGATFVTAALRFAGALALPVLPWIALGAWLPHLPDTPFAGQTGFIGYFLVADREPATWATWWHTRWMNFANTFLPLHVYFAGFDHFRFNSAYGPSGRLVKFAFVWWNSLPFGLGLGLWALGLVALGRASRTFRAATSLFVLGPALLITAYWGWDPLGLMRECGHPLFVAILVLTVVMAAHGGGWLAAVLLHRAVPWLQLPETWLMLWLTTFASRDRLAVEFPQFDPGYVALNVLAFLFAAWVVSRAHAVGGSTPGTGASRPP